MRWKTWIASSNTDAGDAGFAVARNFEYQSIRRQQCLWLSSSLLTSGDLVGKRRRFIVLVDYAEGFEACRAVTQACKGTEVAETVATWMNIFGSPDKLRTNREDVTSRKAG